MKLCQIYNTLPQYRVGIYRLIDKEFDTDWYYGEIPGGIKGMDVSILRGGKYELKNHFYLNKKIYWQSGVLKTLFKPYSKYIILGEERCLSTWAFLFLSLLFPQKEIFFWSHGQYGREGFLKRIVERIFWSFVDGAFVYGNYAKGIMVHNGFNPNKIFVVHNSLDYDKQLELRESGLMSDVYLKHFGNSNPVLIMIGRLNIRKKLPMLLDAVSELKLKGNEYNIVFIGDGEDKQKLTNMAHKKGLDNNVWFYGACYDEKTNAELIYNADLCVVPGDIGLTAIHSMMFGTPVVSHNYFPNQGPEFEAIHPGVTGAFFDKDNVDSLAVTIQKWFDSGKERDVIRRACYNEIDTQWNPYYQIEIFKKGLL